MKKAFALATHGTRQVHLDFHNSEWLQEIGSRFSERQFQKALRLGQVSSVTVFAKCHHSWSYHATTVGHVHPHLRFDLLDRQIKAAHAMGVRAPIYYSVGWSSNDAKSHPEWCVRGPDRKPVLSAGSLTAAPDEARPACSWAFLCPTGAYRDLMQRHVHELCMNYPVDGFFFDICAIPVCYCSRCKASMRGLGYDSRIPSQAKHHHYQTWVEFMTLINRTIRSHHPDATIFYNNTANIDSPPALLDCNTHFELEDLPTTWGGYDKFAPRAKLFSRRAKPLVAMSGKFHTSWGEFGGFKHSDAIRYEAASMIAWGAGCSFGDQLHPSGECDLQTYRNIGAAYKYVRRIEEYGSESTPFSNLGVVLGAASDGRLDDAATHDEGITSMLLENQIDFECIGDADDWTQYETLVFTGGARLSESAAKRLKRYIAGGGSAIIVGEAVLREDGRTTALDIGAQFVGAGGFTCDYTELEPPFAASLCASPFLNDLPALRFKPLKAHVLARIRSPYFDRTYRKYTSHLNTPYQLTPAAHPAIMRHGKVIYFAHPLGRIYHLHGPRLHRELFVRTLQELNRNPVLKVRLPSAGRVNLLHQARKKRYALHLLYAPPLQRGRVTVIEDAPPIHDVDVQLRVPERIKHVQLPLSGESLSMQRTRSGIRVKVPRIEMHQVVAFEY